MMHGKERILHQVLLLLASVQVGVVHCVVRCALIAYVITASLQP